LGWTWTTEKLELYPYTVVYVVSEWKIAPSRAGRSLYLAIEVGPVSFLQFSALQSATEALDLNLSCRELVGGERMQIVGHSAFRPPIGDAAPA
jgi:hypothetical protein